MLSEKNCVAITSNPKGRFLHWKEVKSVRTDPDIICSKPNHSGLLVTADEDMLHIPSEKWTYP